MSFAGRIVTQGETCKFMSKYLKSTWFSILSYISSSVLRSRVELQIDVLE
jgi:hypothetical protein